MVITRTILVEEEHPHSARTQSKAPAAARLVDVEPGEAEWNLDVLEGLFDFYFVGPAESQKKREALEKKLAGAGKPPLKKPNP